MLWIYYVCGELFMSVYDNQNSEIKNIKYAKFSASVQYRIAVSPYEL
jgi:hypothetical protein